MALVVEDGTGVATAESYCSVADADAYFAINGAPATWTGSTAVKEAALRQATQYMDSKYGPLFQGRRNFSAQRLCWPRYPVYIDTQAGLYGDAYGNPAPIAPLPFQLVNACAEFALRFIVYGGLQLDNLTPGVAELSQRAGPVSQSIKYRGEKSSVPEYTKPDAILAPLLTASGQLSRA